MATFRQIRIVSGQLVEVPESARAEEVKDLAAAEQHLGRKQPSLLSGDKESKTSSWALQNNRRIGADRLMAYYELPIDNTADQSFTVTLDGAVYRIHLRYNSRARFWAMDILDAADTQLVMGLAVRLGIDLLAQYADRFPPGRMFAINYADPYVEPNRDNMGSDVRLVYQEAK